MFRCCNEEPRLDAAGLDRRGAVRAVADAAAAERRTLYAEAELAKAAAENAKNASERRRGVEEMKFENGIPPRLPALLYRPRWDHKPVWDDNLGGADPDFSAFWTDPQRHVGQPCPRLTHQNV